MRPIANTPSIFWRIWAITGHQPNPISNTLSHLQGYPTLPIRCLSCMDKVVSIPSSPLTSSLIFIDTVPETPPPSAQSERDTTSFERVSMCQVMQENLALKKKIKRVEKKVTAQKSLKRASRERKRSLRSWKK